MRTFLAILAGALAIFVGAQLTFGGLTIYQGLFDPNAQPDWQAAAGPTTFIGFTEYAPGTTITDQYAHLGVLFGAGDPDFITVGDNGILNALTVADLRFTEPIHAFAVNMQSATRFKFYLGDTLVAEPLGSYGIGFVGFTADFAFDRVVLWNYPQPPPLFTWIFIDDIHFQTIPAPGAMALFGAAVLGIGRRRRRRS